jgi:hypothetical protein
VTSRIDGVGGKMNSFWAMNSLRMSFWVVPSNRSRGTPAFSAVLRWRLRISSSVGGVGTYTRADSGVLSGLGLDIAQESWDEKYYRLESETLQIATDSLPFVGLASSAHEHLAIFLREQGYIVDHSEKAMDCGIFIDDDILAKLSDKVQLIQYIESSTAPLVRYGRWPNGAKSALSITGDLDALTLLDYASRLYTS